jgi:Lipid-droplet associated hydrolase
MLFPSWPAQQVLVLRDFIGSSTAVHSSLAMANEEMKTIRDLDIDVIEQYQHKLWFYYADRDDWVGEEKQRLFGSLDHIRVAHPSRFIVASAGVPHAFCISEFKLFADMTILSLKMPFKTIMKSWPTTAMTGCWTH